MTKTMFEIPSCCDCKVKSVFCSLSNDEKQELESNKGNNFYKKGQAIFYEGNQSHGLYCIFKGKVKLSKLGENGKEQIIRFAKTSDILGYRALFGNEPYQATAIAMEDSYICHLSRENFLKQIKKDPNLSQKLLKVLSEDLRRAEQHLINIAQKTVKERIAETLVLLYNTFGVLDDGKSLDIQLSRAEIADIAGTTTETTIRTLVALSKEKLIKLEGKQIIIQDLKSLENVIGF